MKLKETAVIGRAKKQGIASAFFTAAPAALALGLLSVPVSSALAAGGQDGSFPTAVEVGGEVFIKPLSVGTKIPTDFDIYDENAKKVDFANVLGGKRTLAVFFISAVPVSVAQLKGTEEFVSKYGRGVNLVFVNGDTMGTALMGGPSQAIPSTASTVRLIKKENNLKTDFYVAPNNVFSGNGLATRLGFRSLPTSYLISADGKIEKVFEGPQNWKKGDI